MVAQGGGKFGPRDWPKNPYTTKKLLAGLKGLRSWNCRCVRLIWSDVSICDVFIEILGGMLKVY